MLQGILLMTAVLMTAVMMTAALMFYVAGYSVDDSCV